MLQIKILFNLLKRQLAHVLGQLKAKCIFSKIFFYFACRIIKNIYHVCKWELRKYLNAITYLTF